MVQAVYVVQTFSRDQDGALTRDAPTWSKDRSFAMSLSKALAKRKAGVVTVEAALGTDDELGPEAAIVASHGVIPLELILPKRLGSVERPAADRPSPVKRHA